MKKKHLDNLNPQRMGRGGVITFNSGFDFTKTRPKMETLIDNHFN